MDICVRQQPDNSVAIMSNIGQVICTFHTMQEAIQACREWSHSNNDIMLEALDCFEEPSTHEYYI